MDIQFWPGSLLAKMEGAHIAHGASDDAGSLGVAHRESDLHAHVPEERAHLFHSLDGGSTELEYLNLLSALVLAAKPKMLLETGTGRGFGTISLACAIRANGFGHLHSLESGAGVQKDASDRLEAFDQNLKEVVTFHTCDSLAFIQAWKGEPFDFAFFDTDIAIRHKEFDALMEGGKLEEGALACFHDSSRLRGQASHDSNNEMNIALDKWAASMQSLEFPLSRGLRILRVAYPS